MMAYDNLLRRFLFEEIGVRGQWVKLSSAWQTAQHHQECTGPEQQQLGQALAAVVLLSATIKFQGSLIMQAQGDGPLKTLVAQATHDRKIRGLIRGSNVTSTASLEAMFGEGRLVLTVDTDQGEPYQGIVNLEGKNLAAAVENYFLQSEQLNTRLWLFANKTEAAGLLLQELPSQSNDKLDWQRIEMLASTLTEQELLELSCEEVLYRLFHEEKVILFDAEAVEYACSCSLVKIEKALRFLGRQDLESLLAEQGQIEVNCEFCNKKYCFDAVDIEKLWHEDIASHPQSHLRH